MTQVTSLLSRSLSWAGLGRSMLVLALMWWAWSAFVWVTNAYEEDAGFAGTVAIGLVLLLAGSFVGGWQQDALWAVAVAIDYAGPGLIAAALNGQPRGLIRAGSRAPRELPRSARPALAVPARASLPRRPDPAARA